LGIVIRPATSENANTQKSNTGIHRFKTATMAVFNDAIQYAAAFMPNEKKMIENVSKKKLRTMER